MIIAAVASLGAALWSTSPAPVDLPERAMDPVVEAERRFSAVRGALDRRGVKGPIGYVADVPWTRLGSTPRGVERYFLAQFALAPHVLEADGHLPWAVADLSGRHEPPKGWIVEQDFGSGVELLRAR